MAAGYTVIRVYRDTAEAFTAPALSGTVTLVAGKESYDYTDVTGLVGHWYETCYWGAAVGESAYSAARKSDTMSAYATVDEFRLFSDMVRETDDVELQKLLDAGKRQIDRFCNRADFMSLATAIPRYYTGLGASYQLIDECVEITAVSVKDSPSDVTYTAWVTPTTMLAGDWIPFRGDPSSPEFNRLPYTGIMTDPSGDYSIFTSGQYMGMRGFRPSSTVTRGVPTVRVTARWGYADQPPDDIKVANLMIAIRHYKRLHGSMATSLATADLGTIELFAKMDPDVRAILVDGRYMRPFIR